MYHFVNFQGSLMLNLNISQKSSNNKTSTYRHYCC